MATTFLILAILAVEHPPLVSVGGTTCATCHAELLEPGEAPHAPAGDDCTTCHELTIEDGTTAVATAEEPEVCLVCHDDTTTKTIPHTPVTDSCLFCHDPHASENAGLLSYPVQELCGICHDPSDSEDPHDGQVTAATDCTGCHGPHGSDTPHMLIGDNLHAPFETGSCDACHRRPFGERVRLRVRGERLCTACHGDLTAAAGENGSVHVALQGERGRAGCLSCHDPHLGESSALLTATGPDLCAGCHEETVAAAAATTGHAPAAEDCLQCHGPHAAAGRALLDEPTKQLCGVCHDAADDGLSQAHLGADLADLECTSCHTPHGEGHPNLLARNVHAPIEDGCDTCHDGSYDRLMEDGDSALCLFCHEEVGDAAAASEVPHPAVELARCADCHDPHASSQADLVRVPGDGVCRDCHEEQAAGAGEVAHGVIDLIGCQACHQPHGGNRKGMLRETGPELCLSCHEPKRLNADRSGSTVLLMDRFTVPSARVTAMASLRLSADGMSGHPVTDHRVLGAPTAEELKRTDVDFEGELTCLTCHDPHKGRSETLLRWDAETAGQACRQCHSK